ncbi:MAG: hypothetical protein EXS37_11245 [Opitutus sp.]|nr:hypothetical protein [Opitutus sp.]
MAELESLSSLFRQVPNYRRRLGHDPLYALLGIAAADFTARRAENHDRRAVSVNLSCTYPS